MESPAEPGEYYSPTSITLKPGFSFTSAEGRSLRLYISSCFPLNGTPSTGQNYILKSIPRVAINDPLLLNNRTACDLMQTVQYLDGLGRLAQTIQIKGSPSGRDIVQPIVYDQFGRQTMKYLPYTAEATNSDGSYKVAALADQASFYNSSSGSTTEGNRVGGVIQTTYPYAQTVYENSPLSRVVEQGSYGLAWQSTASPDNDHTLRASFTSNEQTSTFNTSNTGNNPGSRQAAYYQAIVNPDGSYSLLRTGNTATYAPGLLTVSILKNENWKPGDGCFGTTEEYKDKEGNIVLTRSYNIKGSTAEMLSTYYVYDERNQLAYVLPPGVNADDPSPISAASINAMAYQYRYDARGRQTQKKVPGKGWQYMVYNKLDQLVAMQDSVQRMKSPQQWTVTKYDALGRAVMTGIYEYGTTPGNNYLNDIKNAADATGALWETPAATADGYSNTAWPTVMSSVLKVTYYDSYSGIPGLPPVYDLQNNNLYTRQTIGLVTATKTLVLNTSDYLWTVNYYDDEGTVLRTFAQHYLGGSSSLSTFNYDDITVEYNFLKQPTWVRKRHYVANGGSSASLKLTASDVYTYDHMGRKLSTQDTLTNGTDAAQAPIMISKIDYNEIGQPIKKGLHSLNGSSFLQNVDYRYNARGWITHINNPALNNDGDVTNADGNDLFGMELKYENATNAQYNGNIGSANFKTAPYSGIAYDALLFNYDHDKLNRLTSTVSSSASTNDGFYNESVSYDRMGNILSLKRYEKNGASPVLIDDLSYSYTGQQHDRIDDATTEASGFTDAVKQAGEYAYDGNGNEIKDLNKGLTNIAYNLLDLPQTVSKSNGNTVSYVYDADGNKLRKLSTGNGITAINEYINGIQYEYTGSTPTISFIQTEEGRARRSGAVYKYEYDIKDHQGNTRVTFTWDPADATNQLTPTMLQRNDYYAFGSAIASRSAVNSPKNEYLYNGKELQEETEWYDYAARHYDPVIGRWTGVDALGEISLQWSPYTYGKNNPVRYIDPSGMADKDSKGGDSDDDMDEGMFGSGQDMFGRDKYDRGSGMYIPSFERGDIDWSNLSRIYASQSRPQRMAGDENANKVGDPHAAELAKYGKVQTAFNITGTASMGWGGTIEFGYVTSSKNYAQYYYTVYYTNTVALGVGSSLSWVFSKKGKNTTFSDIAGPVYALSGGAYYGSLSYSQSSTYHTLGPGLSASYGFRYSASGSIGYTYLIGEPILMAPKNGEFTNSYISRFGLN